MKKVFKYKKELKELILTPNEKHLVRMIFRDLDNKFIPGHDDFYNYECIGVYEYDKIKKKFGIKPRKK